MSTPPPKTEILLSESSLPRLQPPPAPEEHGSARRLTRSCLLALVGAAAALYIADHLRGLLVPIALAVLMNLALGPVVRQVSRVMPRILASALVLMTLLGTIVGLFFLAAPGIEAWLGSLPEILESLRSELLASPQVEALLDAKAQAEATSAQLTTAAIPVRFNGQDTEQWLLASTDFIGSGILALFLTLMMLSAGDRFRERLSKAMRDSPLQKRVVDAARDVESSVSTYVLSVTAINAALGVVVGTAMWALGLGDPLIWGLLAGVLNFVPYIGPLFTLVFIAVGGFSAWGGLDGLIIPPLVYLCINAVEAFAVTPLILGRRLRISPVATLLSVLFWTWLWGFGGALIAIPALVLMHSVCTHITALRPIAILITR